MVSRTTTRRCVTCRRGGLNSSVEDLSHFLKMVFAGGKAGETRALRPETAAEMLRPQNGRVVLDRNFKLGLGWILGGLGDINIENAGVVAHHGGATLRGYEVTSCVTLMEGTRSERRHYLARSCRRRYCRAQAAT